MMINAERVEGKLKPAISENSENKLTSVENYRVAPRDFFPAFQTLRSQTIKCLTQKPKFCSQKSKCWSHVQMQTQWFLYKRSLLLTTQSIITKGTSVFTIKIM